MSDHDDLRQAAENATPGKWRDAWDEADRWWVIYGQPHGEHLSPEVATTDSRDGADAHYIALANPTRILALLDERDALAAAVERVRALHEKLTTLAGERFCRRCQMRSEDMWPCETIAALDGEADS